MTLIDGMKKAQEMLTKYDDQKCVSIIVIKDKASLGAGINTKDVEEHCTTEIGIHVIYSVGIEEVPFKRQESAIEDYVLTQQSNIPLIPID